MIKILIALFIAIFGAAGSFVSLQASNNHTSSNSSNANSGLHGAPGPIAGAGIPVLVVGYGAYWLMRRRRKRNQQTK